MVAVTGAEVSRGAKVAVNGAEGSRGAEAMSALIVPASARAPCPSSHARAPRGPGSTTRPAPNALSGTSESRDSSAAAFGQKHVSG